MYFMLTTLKIPPPNVITPIFFCYFFLALGSTRDSTDCWSTHRSPAARESIDRVASAGCPPPPPNQKPWLRRWPPTISGRDFFGWCLNYITDIIVSTRVASHLARSDTPSITCIVARLSRSDTPTLFWCPRPIARLHARRMHLKHAVTLKIWIQKIRKKNHRFMRMRTRT